jgi:hypothetical protein
MAKLVVLVPPGPSASLGDWRPVAVAYEACVATKRAARLEVVCEVSVLTDEELGPGIEVLELLGEGAVVDVPVNIPLPFFVVHVKDVGRFFAFDLTLTDSSGATRSLHYSNHISYVRIAGSAASLPIVLTGLGWHLLRLDLGDVCARAFGTSFVACTHVALTSSARYSRVYFEAHPQGLADHELPTWMRVLREQ